MCILLLLFGFGGHKGTAIPLKSEGMEVRHDGLALFQGEVGGLEGGSEGGRVWRERKTDGMEVSQRAEGLLEGIIVENCARSMALICFLCEEGRHIRYSDERLPRDGIW